MTTEATFGSLSPEVIGEIYECNFENENFTIVSFSVGNETRWRTGKYKICLINGDNYLSHADLIMALKSAHELIEEVSPHNLLQDERGIRITKALSACEVKNV